LLDIEFVVQMGLLLNASEYPEVISSAQVTPQLKALHDCGWLSTEAHRILDSAYAQLSHARLQADLVDDSASVKITPLLNIAQALCDEILG
jgi:glutamine synthetase adenylyltransferase